jgi:hypothetical protein
MAMRGHWALEITFTHRGDFPLAVEHFEKALALYRPDQHRDDAFLYALNPGVAMRCFAAWSLWFCGRPISRSVRMQEAMNRPASCRNPQPGARSVCCGPPPAPLGTRADAGICEAVFALSTEHGMVLPTMGTILRGWALWGSRTTRTRSGMHGGDWQPGRPPVLSRCGRTAWACWPRCCTPPHTPRGTGGGR